MKYSKRIICAGNGLAALNLALHLDDDTQLLILAAADFSATNSYLAKGGIAIPLQEEDAESHIQDTLTAGDGLCDEAVVRELIYEAPAVVNMLKRFGLNFDPSLSREGGHSCARIHHVADETGKHVVKALYQQVKRKKNVKILAAHHLLNLYMDQGVCAGAIAGDCVTQKVKLITADAIVLATGGCGNLYHYHTNASFANGEGYAIAERAGAQLTDMEFVQFHPTRLYDPLLQHHLLITEAFRGAGAVLRDRAMRDLMADVHPLGSLAPRDVVSRSMHTCMKESGLDFLWLDFSKVDMEVMQRDFPALFSMCTQKGYLKNKRIPVTPAAHFMCGGVVTDTFGATTIPGLYAVGEVARTGLHGANRLASNSLMELLVISKRLAERLNETGKVNKHQTIELPTTSEHPHAVYADPVLRKVKRIMWEYFGIVRNAVSMQHGLEELYQLEACLPPLSHSADIALQQTHHAVHAATLIARSALMRKESRGCHYREDFSAAYHTLQQKNREIW